MSNNLKNEYPDVPENFHNRVVSTLDSLQAYENTSSRRFSPARVAALAAALIALLAVTVFAGNEVYQRFINKENYKVTFELGEESSSQSAEYVKLNFGYIPEYLKPVDAPYKYNVGDSGAGLTFQLFKSELAKELEITFVGSVEECMFGKCKGAVIRIDTGVESDGESYSRNFVIYFDDFGYVLRCYVSDAVSDEEMMKIANGLSLEETDKEHAFIIDTYVPGAEVMSEAVLAENKKQRVDKNIGEKFNMSAFSGTDVNADYSVAVKGFEIRDNIIGLDLDCIWLNGGETEEYFDENGNLKDYVRNTYEYGDGINTLNSIKKSETVGRKLVLVDIEIENTENYAYLFNSDFYLSNSGGEHIRAIINYISGQNAESADYMFIPFEAGENKIVTFGFIVDDDIDLSGLTLEMEGDNCIKYCIDLNS
ncbi:MAG: hypothetical protein IJZ35_02820 [Clostridia bacterium]|nr:hypothetical protein [Clostridia bacterium]